MTSDTLMYRDRLHIFKYYLEHVKHGITITGVCHIFGRSHTWFYRWYKRYVAYGEEGLRDIERSILAMPN